jgi:hypothetical protein
VTVEVLYAVSEYNNMTTVGYVQIPVNLDDWATALDSVADTTINVINVGEFYFQTGNFIVLTFIGFTEYFGCY